MFLCKSIALLCKSIYTVQFSKNCAKLLMCNRLHYSANRFAQCIFFPKIAQNSLCAIDCTLGAIDYTVKKMKIFNSFSLQIEILGK